MLLSELLLPSFNYTKSGDRKACSVCLINRVCDPCFEKLQESGTNRGNHTDFDAREDEEFEKAIQESLALAEREKSRQKEKEKRQREDREREREEAEIQRAIEESLKLSEEVNGKRHPVSKSFDKPRHVTVEKEVEIVPIKPHLSPTELDNIRIFCETIEHAERQIAAQGIQSVNILQLQTLFAKSVPLHSKLVKALEIVDERYRKLYEFNTEIGDVVGAYDSMLRNRFMYSGLPY